MSEKLLTIKQASELLQVKISWLRSMVFRKEIPYLKLGRLIRFKHEDLTSFINRSKT